jgi:hypothetical protein
MIRIRLSLNRSGVSAETVSKLVLKGEGGEELCAERSIPCPFH